MENFDNIELTQDVLKNRLFCTFVDEEGLNDLIEEINREYVIMYRKIFVLSSKDSGELMCTYNIDPDFSQPRIIKNTILVHRKKETNTLYTINSLNTLIMELNGGRLDSSFQVHWPTYKNSILLVQDGRLKILNTEVRKIVQL
jgi:hypothetical protein